MTTPATPTGYPHDVPPEVLSIADRAVQRIHESLDHAPLALVVSAYRAGYADGQQSATGVRPTPHLDAVKAERDKLVETVGRMISLPPHLVAEAYGVTYTGEVQS